MIKTYITGVLLGIAATIAAVYFFPVVDQYRESSIITVAPNGGNVEAFHINIPMDRIVAGAADLGQPVPQDMEWPLDPALIDTRTELFKLRNANDSVIGIASRVAGESEIVGDTIEWVLHFPARGSMFVSMSPQAVEGGYRVGSIAAGTREFTSLTGQVTERWISSVSAEQDSQAGRIELVSSFVSTVEPEDPFVAEMEAEEDAE